MGSFPGAAPAASLVTCVVLAAAVSGCGPSEVPPDQAGAIPVYNPSPDNPTQGVTLENEAENLDKIGGITKPGGESRPRKPAGPR
jgi:hypothetical protein